MYNPGDLSFPTWVNYSYWNNNSDVYIRVDDHMWYDGGGLMCFNAFDTGIRRGKISDPARVIQGALKCSPDTKAGDLIVSLVRGNGFWLEFRDGGWDTTYINIGED